PVAIAHLTDAKSRQQRSVPRQHADLAVGCRKHYFVCFGVDDLSLARDHREVDLGREIGHGLSLRRFRFHALSALENHFDRSLQQEGLLRNFVMLAFDDLAEAANRVGDLDVLAFDAGELLGHMERLREKALNLARAADDDLVFFRQLVDAENCDDVLEVLVLLQNRLHAARSVVVLVAEDARVEDLGGRRERIDGGIDAQLRDLARENRRRIEVCECGRRRRIGEIVCRDVDRLHRRDRSLLRRRDALLQLAHFRREVRLVADGARHASEKRRHFRSRLREAEDVVDEEQHVLPFDVAEVFGDGEAGETNAQTRTRRLRHLSVDQSSLRVRRIARHDDLRLFELEIEVVSFARTLTDAREHGEAGALLRDVVDELHDQNGLADTGAAEQAGLAALGVRFEKVDDLDARLEHLDVGRLFVEGGRLAMDGPVSFRVHRTFVVDWLPENVQDAAERLPSDRNGDRRTEIDRLHAADHSVRRLHRDATNLVLTDVVRDFDDDIDLHFAELTVIDDANRVVDR